MKHSGYLRQAVLIAFVCPIVAAALVVAGCSAPSDSSRQPGAVSPPAPWVLSSPKSAVRSYLDWVSYAYRMVNSDAATQTMSADEEVRVNSYVQLNREAGKLINQRLVSLEFGSESTEGTRVLVPTRESWEYRYLSVSTLQSLTPTYTASYETTYTLISPRPGVWVVDSVAAKALGEVK